MTQRASDIYINPKSKERSRLSARSNLNNGLKDFINVFSYDTNPIKTNNQQFVTTINCKKEIALEQMILTKKQFRVLDFLAFFFISFYLY